MAFPSTMFATKLSIAIIWSIVIQNCLSSRYAQLSIIDSATDNFLSDEKRLWHDILTQTNRTGAQNVTLAKTVEYFEPALNRLNNGRIAVVEMVSTKLADHIRAIDRTQASTLQWLTDRRYDAAYEQCEEVTQRIPAEVAGIFEMTKSQVFVAHIRENSDFCQASRPTPNATAAAAADEQSSLQNTVMDFYTTVAEALIKGYMNTQLAYMVLAIKSDPNKYQRSSAELSQTFTTNHRALVTNVRSVFRNFSGEIWSCDDFEQDCSYSSHPNGSFHTCASVAHYEPITKPRANAFGCRVVSYTQITNFIQGYIDNEVNLNVDGSCRKTCDDYNLVTTVGCKNHTICTINYLDKNKTRCAGTIRSCTYIDADMRLCPNEDDTSHYRRYNYVHYDNGVQFGRDRYCSDEFRVKSWIRWFVHCSYCFCYCDQEGPFSDRYFSLRESISDTSTNRVVTGIRFLKKGGIIHIFISERELGAYGHIKESSATPSEATTWKSDYNFLVDDSGVTSGRDYHTLTHENRAIDLDIIRAPIDEVVTGARFRFADGRLRFEIRTTQFDYKTGYLSREYTRSVWRGNNRYMEKEQKDKINIDNCDVPTLSPQKSRRYRGDNQYIEFTPTDVHLDMAQTTVPFIDTQPVEATTPKPLQGAGIYYKSTPGYGGFIGPLIILHDSN